MKKTILLLTITALGLSSHAENLKRDDWTWSSSSICAAGTDSDIAGLDGIHDGDTNTCWHSNYLADSSSPERRNPHWIQIDRGADRSEFTGLSYLPRQLSPKTACTSYYIYLSNADMSATPATSAQDIVAALGEPTFSGSLAGDITEKHIDFKDKFTSRYILFVNVESNGSGSAACAEMNLFNGAPSSVTPNPGSGNYNAICITPSASGAEPHRIAIQGNKLTASVVHGYVRLGNEDITVEYAMADVARFNFEHYDFGDNSYTGDQKDIYTARFTPVVTPAAGTVGVLDEVSIEITPAANHRINAEVSQPVTLTRSTTSIMSVDAASLPDFATDKGYTFTGIGASSAGTYLLSIPEELFILADGSRSNAVEHQWSLSGSDGIGSVTADYPTLTFSRSGATLTVGGIRGDSAAQLFNTAGRSVASAPVNSRGVALFNVGALAKGVYLLHVNGLTLKIIL